MATIEERLTNLENLVNALIKSRANDKIYTDADINGVKKGVSTSTSDININMKDISDIRFALGEVYEMIEGE